MNKKELVQLLKKIYCYLCEDLDMEDSTNPQKWFCNKFNITAKELKEILKED